MKKLLALILLLVLICASFGAAQTKNVGKTGTVAVPFLNVGQGARALGMGSAFVALANDPSAMYWNPSGITELKGINLMVDHTYWIADLQYDYLGATANLGSFGAVGVNLTVSSYGEMKVTTVDQQDGTNEVFSVTDLAVGITYALPLTDNFSIGFNPKVVYEQIWNMSASTVAIDMGVKYHTPFKGFTLGMAITNFGGTMQMHGTKQMTVVDLDPSTTGNNATTEAELAGDKWELPLLFRVGLAYDASLGDLGKLTITADALHPNDNYESVNMGAEYVFDDMLYIRGGMKSMFLPHGEEGFTLGAGIKQFVLGNVSFSVDYAYQEFGRLKNAQKLTLGIGL